jgi:predicted DNA-binding transcriptional regulator AlpA
MNRDMYLTNKEACRLLCVSRATFYRSYYPC